ncbi:MAG: alkaline shock response membrane anchor protein AmaP [Clostridiaceae bacterium]|jgi:uncharacterized alkaline shock family protein YloU|nr:alkaline shock response membrane anchor protein AmaP [Clostridiaceae bacterium]
MKILFRVLLAVYAFCLAVFSAFAMYVVIVPQAFVDISESIIHVISTDNATALRVAVFVTALLFFALSIMFLLSGVRSGKDKKAVSKHTNIGEIRISLNSIENIAINACKRSNGIKESKTLVKKADDGVDIEVRVVVMPDISIPVISEEVQGCVKKSVEDASGITVRNVRVIVDSIYSGVTYKPRVE